MDGKSSVWARRSRLCTDRIVGFLACTCETCTVRYAYRSKVVPPQSESSLYIDALYYRTVLNLEKVVLGGLQFLFTNTHYSSLTHADVARDFYSPGARESVLHRCPVDP